MQAPIPASQARKPSGPEAEKGGKVAAEVFEQLSGVQEKPPSQAHFEATNKLSGEETKWLVKLGITKEEKVSPSKTQGGQRGLPSLNSLSLRVRAGFTDFINFFTEIASSFSSPEEQLLKKFTKLAKTCSKLENQDFEKQIESFGKELEAFSHSLPAKEMNDFVDNICEFFKQNPNLKGVDEAVQGRFEAIKDKIETVLVIPNQSPRIARRWVSRLPLCKTTPPSDGSRQKYTLELAPQPAYLILRRIIKAYQKMNPAQQKIVLEEFTKELGEAKSDNRKKFLEFIDSEHNLKEIIGDNNPMVDYVPNLVSDKDRIDYNTFKSVFHAVLGDKK